MRSGFLERRRGTHSQKIVNLSDRFREVGRRDGVAYAPSGNAVGLAHAVDRNSAVAHTLQGCNGAVRGAVIEDVLIDLVGQCQGIPLDAQTGNKPKFVAAENLSRGIVRRIYDD